MAILSLFSRKQAQPDLELLSEPRATRELERALTEIERATEYVQSWLAVMDDDIAQRVAKRARVANALETSLAHKIDAPEPEVLGNTRFRDQMIAEARAARTPINRYQPPIPGSSVQARPSIDPQVFDTKEQVKARLTQMGEALSVAASSPSRPDAKAT